MPTNPFLEAQDLLSEAHKTGDHLSHGENTCKEPHIWESNMPGVLASTCTKLDINKVWISARHNLAHSILRLHKGLAYYFVGKYVNWTCTSDYFLAEMEGVLCLSAK